MKKYNFGEAQNNPDLDQKHIPFHYFTYSSDGRMMVMRMYSGARYQGSNSNSVS